MKPLNTASAGKWLYKKSPNKSEESWIQFLKNNRRNDRNPAFRIPFSNISGDAYYLLEDLNRYYAWEKVRVIQEIRNNRYAGMKKYLYELDYDAHDFRLGTDFNIRSYTFENIPYANLAFHTARVTFKLTVPEVRNLVNKLTDFLTKHEQSAE